MNITKKQRRQRRAVKTRAHIRALKVARLTVHRTPRHIYAQVFDDKGEVRPITVLQAGPCVVTQLKNNARDGYEAAQIGLVEFVKESRLTQPMKGHFGKNNLPPMRFLREVEIVVDEENQDGAKVGDKVLVDMFDGTRPN